MSKRVGRFLAGAALLSTVLLWISCNADILTGETGTPFTGGNLAQIQRAVDQALADGKQTAEINATDLPTELRDRVDGVAGTVTVAIGHATPRYPGEYCDAGWFEFAHSPSCNRSGYWKTNLHTWYTNGTCGLHGLYSEMWNMTYNCAYCINYAYVGWSVHHLE